MYEYFVTEKNEKGQVVIVDVTEDFMNLTLREQVMFLDMIFGALAGTYPSFRFSDIRTMYHQILLRILSIFLRTTKSVVIH